MKPLVTSNFDYELAESFIAQQPLERRDRSRLMVLRRPACRPEHHVFSQLPSLLCAGDLLILNNTKVIPAKFAARRKTGGRIEGLFLREHSAGAWEVMLRNAQKCADGETLTLDGADGVTLQLRQNLGEGRWQLAVSPQMPAVEILQQAGTTPLPPYIRRGGAAHSEFDAGRYQTVYAQTPGAVAAPTAGLHFTPEIFDALASAGVRTANVTLHVGMGTFLPVKDESLGEHKMHSEWYTLSQETADAVNQAHAEGRRVVAVGTTAVRVLETVVAQRADVPSAAKLCAASGWTDIFIYPPYRFGAVDALITNFHLPRSTLLMLVAAFCSPGNNDGIAMILSAYEQAKANGYRFFSYGDAMLIE